MLTLLGHANPEQCLFLKVNSPMNFQITRTPQINFSLKLVLVGFSSYATEKVLSNKTPIADYIGVNHTQLTIIGFAPVHTDRPLTGGTCAVGSVPYSTGPKGP